MGEPKLGLFRGMMTMMMRGRREEVVGCGLGDSRRYSSTEILKTPIEIRRRRRRYASVPMRPRKPANPPTTSAWDVTESPLFFKRLREAMFLGPSVDQRRFFPGTPYPAASLDDPHILNVARFAIDQNNYNNDKFHQLVKVVRANVEDNVYYLDLDAMTWQRNMRIFHAFVHAAEDGKWELRFFQCFGDPNNPRIPCRMTLREKDGKHNYFNPSEDVIKYLEQEFDVDEDISSGAIIPFQGPLDGSEITCLGRSIVERYNKLKNAQLKFIKVVKATRQVITSRCFFVTLEADDAGERKIFQATHKRKWGPSRLVLMRQVDNNGNLIKTVFSEGCSVWERE